MDKKFGNYAAFILFYFELNVREQLSCMYHRYCPSVHPSDSACSMPFLFVLLSRKSSIFSANRHENILFLKQKKDKQKWCDLNVREKRRIPHIIQKFDCRKRCLCTEKSNLLFCVCLFVCLIGFCVF